MEKPKIHQISLFSGIMLALNSLIGSGWLFGAGTAAKVAGPAAILSWILGAVIIIAIALTYVELGAMFPESGGYESLRSVQSWRTVRLHCCLGELDFTDYASSHGSSGLGAIHELMAVELG